LARRTPRRRAILPHDPDEIRHRWRPFALPMDQRDACGERLALKLMVRDAFDLYLSHRRRHHRDTKPR
jgi:hypothetical protein